MTIIQYRKQTATNTHEAFQHINEWEQPEIWCEMFKHTKATTNFVSLSKYTKILPPVDILASLFFGQP